MFHQQISCMFVKNVKSLLKMLISCVFDNGGKIEITNDWKYRGEGNCNVCLSLPKTKKILRIRKVDKPKTLFAWLLTWLTSWFNWYWCKSVYEEMRDLKFYMKVMRPLLGKNYVSRAKQVDLRKKQIKIIESRISKYRPRNRKHKILHYARSTVFDDYAYLSIKNHQIQLEEDVFAVEIKPKQGWRPFTERCFPQCVFCMKQQTNKLVKVTQYCPEDLFSGNKQKMTNAIKALVEIPQNYFKVFKNGDLYYGNGADPKMEFATVLQEFFNSNSSNITDLKEEFCEIVQKCLVKNLCENDAQVKCDKNLFCQWNTSIQDLNLDCKLPKGCVLEKILSIQMLDSDGTQYYYKLLSNEALPLKDWTYVKRLLDAIEEFPETCLKCTIMLLSNNENSDLIYVPYLISAIAKDLSLMVTFGRIKNETNNTDCKNVIQTKYGKFYFNISIFDLYPKPMSTVKKHFIRNTAIFKSLRDKHLKLE